MSKTVNTFTKIIEDSRILDTLTENTGIACADLKAATASPHTFYMAMARLVDLETGKPRVPKNLTKHQDTMFRSAVAKLMALMGYANNEIWDEIRSAAYELLFTSADQMSYGIRQVMTETRDRYDLTGRKIRDMMDCLATIDTHTQKFTWRPYEAAYDYYQSCTEYRRIKVEYMLRKTLLLRPSGSCMKHFITMADIEQDKMTDLTTDGRRGLEKLAWTFWTEELETDDITPNEREALILGTKSVSMRFRLDAALRQIKHA